MIYCQSVVGMYLFFSYDATEDHLNIDKHRYIIPAHKLLGAVRSALLPSVLKKLFSRHMHTREMPNESLEEETLIEVCVFFLLPKFAELQYKILLPLSAKSSLSTLDVLYFICKSVHHENQILIQLT